MEDGVGEDAIQQGSKKPHPVVHDKLTVDFHAGKSSF